MTEDVSPIMGHLGLVTLHVSDLDRAVTFYRDTLGLPLATHQPDDQWAEFETGGPHLGIHADPQGTEAGARAPGGPSGFYFQVRNVDEVVKTLREKGVTIEDEPADKPYGRDATISDPDGNVIALVQASEE